MSSNSPAPGAGQMPPQNNGPPYLPTTASLGGLPTPIPDDPISAVLLALFVGSAALHMAIFQINLRRSHKFIFSVLLFGFSMARITALAMRLAWASHPTNTSIAIAANVFVAAGVLLLFLVNLMFAQRVVRAYHPAFGWNTAVRWVFRGLYASVVGVLVMVVTVSVHMFFTLDVDVRARERSVQLFAGTYLAVLAFLPIPIVLVARAAASGRKARHDDEEGTGTKVVREKFGTGRFRTKIWLLLVTSALLTLGAGFRVGVNFAPRPLANPAWYHSKPAYYCFNYVIELIVVYAYGLARFDRRFHVPDGAKGPGDYSAGKIGVNREEDVFGPDGDQDGDGDDTSGTAPVGGADESEHTWRRSDMTALGDEGEYGGRKSGMTELEKQPQKQEV
ncbi:hypothetical protein QBC47DRAFT_385391 [Echria macrotheca]|uniref:DUF7702 domain-containing protein n=1 Tax=Echria macrotheca TaxID=438768 RepID=A0AAJ0FA97_9PEZI|nr:hypothetical protein QBC47DRAFT_385391 [Echria macrotheca]